MASTKSGTWHHPPVDRGARPRTRFHRLALCSALLGVLVPVTLASAAVLETRAAPARWDAPSDPLKRTAMAGLKAEKRESLTFHVHAHLDVFVDKRPVVVPAGIGINTKDPGVKRFRDPKAGIVYGGIEGCAQPCISPLHTHDGLGIIHTESATPKPNRLGQFFTEWGVRLDRNCVGTYCSPGVRVAIYVDGKRFKGDPRTIELTDRREIAIVVGTPPAKIPSSADFSNA